MSDNDKLNDIRRIKHSRPSNDFDAIFDDLMIDLYVQDDSQIVRDYADTADRN
jgi:hypothetical protein